MTVPPMSLTDAYFSAGDLIPLDLDHIVPPFEGPEKTLEIEFANPSPRLRSIPRHVWDDIILDAGATILECRSDDYADSYLLSESSLFVFEDKIMIKTCGTTTLLHALPKLISACNDLKSEISWITYSRKNFLFPHDQRGAHKNFEDETSYMTSLVPLTHSCSLGPEESDHMFVCASKVQSVPVSLPVYTFTMMMYGLHSSAATRFVRSDAIPDGVTMTRVSGIRKLLPDAMIHEWAFDPCGYSMNALLEKGAYATVHVTPQQSCSYASFETNAVSLPCKALIDQVLQIFQPTRFTVSVNLRGRWMNEDPMPIQEKELTTSTSQTFARVSADHTKLDDDRCFYMANFVKQ